MLAKKRTWVFASLTVFTIVIFTFVLVQAEKVHLKNGDTITGSIVDFQDDKFTIELDYGTLKVYRNEIARIVFSKTQETEPALLFESSFENTPLGEEPNGWTPAPSFDNPAIFKVVSGGANGSEKSLRLKGGDPYGQDPDTGRYGSAFLSPKVNSKVSEIEWYWKKRHKWDTAGGYGDKTPHGPGFHLLNNSGDTFVHISIGGGSEHPLPLGVEVGRKDKSPKQFPNVIENGEFKKFQLNLNFNKQTFELRVGNSNLGRFPFLENTDKLDRIRFKTGGWGVNGDSEIDEVKVWKR